MSLLNDSLLFAQAAPQAQSPLPTLLFFGLMFAAMYFLMIAPQRKKQKEHEKMLAALQIDQRQFERDGLFAQGDERRHGVGRQVVGVNKQLHGAAPCCARAWRGQWSLTPVVKRRSDATY